jgi:hypothetical protein
MTFFAYCPYCETKVDNATPVLGDAALKLALQNDADIEVVHLTGPGSSPCDHQWRLNREEKARLRGWLAGPDRSAS